MLLGTQPEAANCLPNWPFVYWLARNYEPRFAQCWACILLPPGKKYDTGPSPVFFDSICIGTRICSFCIDMNLWIFVLVLVAGRSCESRVPIIGQSGLVKGHSLSRRHRQYIMCFEIMRLSFSCFYRDVFHYHFSLMWFPLPDTETLSCHFSYSYWTISV